jgi:hypothetical protein
MRLAVMLYAPTGATDRPVICTDCVGSSVAGAEATLGGPSSP